MKKELSAGTTDEQRDTADSGRSASLAQNGMLYGDAVNKKNISNFKNIKIMKREILFRGQTMEDGRWIYGSLTIEFDGTCHINYWVSKLVEPENNYYEMVHQMKDVFPESVGQYTGLKDKNGKKVFEGDFIQYLYADFENPIKHEVNYVAPSFSIPEETEFEIIGNIQDNPELINSGSIAV